MTEKLEFRLQVHMILCWDALPAEIEEAWAIIKLSPAKERFKDGQAQMNWKKDGCTYLGTLDSIREINEPEKLPAAEPRVPDSPVLSPGWKYTESGLGYPTEDAPLGRISDGAHTRVDVPEVNE